MKITTAKTYVSAMAVAAIILSGGVLYTMNVADQHKVASAYTSVENAQDPATAPDTYEVNIPDANLKAALNNVIAKAMNAERQAPRSARRCGAQARSDNYRQGYESSSKYVWSTRA